MPCERLFEAGNDRAMAEQDHQRLAFVRAVDRCARLVGQVVVEGDDFVFLGLHRMLLKTARMVQGAPAAVI
jgi:hypothetical protein